MEFNLPDYVKKIINTLENSGFEAYCVGGCVRDMLLGKTPQDYDIATNALPENITKCFEHTVLTGAKHGTVTVVINKKSCEVTTYRTDGKYQGNRKPENVTFVSSIREDLSRRDFTVNALAYKNNEILDLFSGCDDLKNKILRTVGNPYDRFDEDALRILRLFRFASVLGFGIEPETLNAALEKSNLLRKISKERIASELIKLICGDYPEKLNALTEYGGLDFLEIHNGDFSLLKLYPKHRELRFYIFSVISETDPEKLVSVLRLDNKLKKYCADMKSLYKADLSSDKNIKKALNLYSENAVRDTMLINGYDLKAMERIITSKEPYRIKDLNINGDDLKRYGYSGEQIGEKLNEILDALITDPDADLSNIISH